MDAETKSKARELASNKPPETASTEKKVVPAVNDDADDDEDEDRLCVICWDAPKDTLIQPCNHLCLCHSCATKVDHRGVRISQCPMCRGNVFDTIKVFF